MKISGRILDFIKEYAAISFGAVLYAFAFNWIFVPNNIAMGGFTGLAQTINYFIPIIPVGTITIILNVPLFMIGAKKQGIRLLVSSLYAMTLSSVFIDVLPLMINFSPMDDQLLSCIMGGVLTGASSGVTLWAGATTGGTELLARVIKYWIKHISVGKIILAADLTAVLLYALAYGQIQNALYGAVSLYVSSITIDVVIYGRRTAKVACIICDKPDKIKKIILDLNMGITQLRSVGGFSGDEKSVLICAFKPRRIAALKMAVTKSDPNAFVIVCEAQDVFGEGFENCDIDDL